MDRNTPVQILWTGGWDSTFRLLQLLLELKLEVIPHYVIDDTRESAPTELRTMERIRQALADKYPETRDRLHPTRIGRVTDLQPEPDVQVAFERVASRFGIGNQYAWLSRYCHQNDIHGIELGAENTVRGAGAVVDGQMVPGKAPQGYDINLVRSDGNPDLIKLFGRFAYGLDTMTRADMAESTRRNAWGEIMGLTWFCHHPTRENEPCGTCNPCLNVIDEGFGWRISPRRRALAAVYRWTVRPLRKSARRWLLRFRVRGHRPGAPAVVAKSESGNEDYQTIR